MSVSKTNTLVSEISFGVQLLMRVPWHRQA